MKSRKAAVTKDFPFSRKSPPSHVGGVIARYEADGKVPAESE